MTAHKVHTELVTHFQSEVQGSSQQGRTWWKKGTSCISYLPVIAYSRRQEQCQRIRRRRKEEGKGKVFLYYTNNNSLLKSHFKKHPPVFSSRRCKRLIPNISCTWSITGTGTWLCLTHSDSVPSTDWAGERHSGSETSSKALAWALFTIGSEVTLVLKQRA